MLIGAAISIVIAAVREILTPHHTPAWYTLVVVAGVVLVKETLFRKVIDVGADINSSAVKADAWHHRSDAITSLAAFVGIAIAIWGGKGWEAADDWAAIVAAGIIATNGARLMMPALHDLMDRTPPGDLLEQIAAAAQSVAGVLLVEKLRVRRVGTEFYVDLHVQADPGLSLHDAHILSGKVKSAIRAALPTVKEALIHMEPFENP
jgi:cation diffusion facilitator family transporter